MDLQTKKDILNILYNMLIQVLNGTDNFKLGICCEVSNALGVIQSQWVRDVVFTGWEHHSGDNTFPIPGEFDAYRLPPHWEGEQRQYRISLLCYSIRKLYLQILEEE